MRSTYLFCRALHRRTNSRSTLFSGPRSGIVPSARTAGNGAGGARRLVGKPFNPDMLYSGTLSLMLRIKVSALSLGEQGRKVSASRRDQSSTRILRSKLAGSVAVRTISFWPQLIRDAHSRTKCAEIVSNVAVYPYGRETAHPDDALFEVCEPRCPWHSRIPGNSPPNALP